MAFLKSEKKARDMMSDEMWKNCIRTEDKSVKDWQNNWNWIMDEYLCLQKKLKEKSDQSKFLPQILEEKKEDPRKLVNFPKTTNHEYGWVAAQKEFQLDRYGPDIFQAQYLPDIYYL
ncbi:hypothetical protein ABEB36_004021 [Hypothenemus hampei]|uniref:Uncharacterized protein n=1 Tax=Hypothenemus hampei TaxID=57062 RepID=A0ABD1F2I2_HYPHA